MDTLIFKTRDLQFNNMIDYCDIAIHEYKATFITGESGTGKSTLLKLFNGTLSQSNGEIFYSGKSIQEADTILLRKEVSLISQGIFLFDASIKENFEMFYEYREEAPPTDDEINEFLRICCIFFPLDKDCTTMSGGERQRIYMAIYLSFIPKVIMLDEPTSALDTKNSHDVIENILLFCKKNHITAIVVSHDKELTKRFAEDIIEIRKGVK
ncbi:MAG: ATP-binding cassette domain-containing protein [Clostridia bacterium]